MKGLNPRARQRVEVVSVRPTMRGDLTNAELLEAWESAMMAGAKLAAGTVNHYKTAIADAIRYMQTPEGREVPARKWSKADVWAWVHFVEANYCANFQQIAFTGEPKAKCKARVWVGTMPAEDAAQQNCSGCPFFRRLGNTKHRLHAVDKWFSYLARVGVVPVNFVPDVVREWYEENPRRDTGNVEKKRNPTVAEQVCLVNGTTHPRNRFFYAASLKWMARPREMLKLDRYASFGLPMPPGRAMPPGHEEGFAKYPELESFDEGGTLVYLPENRDENGNALPDKRRGNRWFVTDAELRPLAEQYFAWWERTVQRDETGAPKWTELWLWDDGTPVRPVKKNGGLPTTFHDRTFYADAMRLGLMQPGDREDPRRRWAAHCQRHTAQRICQEYHVPDNWNNHFRGDAFKDARGHYYKPSPQEVRAKYLELVPLLGFKPLPEAPRLRAGGLAAMTAGQKETHRAILAAEATRVERLRKRGVQAVCVRVVCDETGEAWTVPRRVGASFLYAVRLARPGRGVRVEPDAEETGPRGRWMDMATLLRDLEMAIGMLVSG